MKKKPLDQRAYYMPRDAKILQSLFEQKVMSRDQIKNHFFNHASKQCVNRRMSKLKKMGLVKSIYLSSDSKVQSGYSLTSFGLEKIKPILPYQLKGKSLQSECPEHDVLLFDIRNVISKKSMFSDYQTENVLQSAKEYQENEAFIPFIEQRSDARLSLKTKVGTLHLALEYEHSKKSPLRYREKIDHYYRKNSIDGVLYVCADHYILDSVLRIDQEISKQYQCDSKLYCALLSDVMSSQKELIFRNADQYIFRVS